MAAVQKSNSVRKARPPVRRPSFRDDFNLVAIRYEKTLQGEAPTPITTVNPIRTPSRPASSASCSTAPASPSPIVVLPPREPPEEQHPALRTGQILPPKEEWKRDSGHGAPSSSSTPTIDEEVCEDESDDVNKLVSDLSAVQRHDAQFVAAVDNVAEDDSEPEPVRSERHDRSAAGRASTPNHQQRPMSPARFVFEDDALRTHSTSPAVVSVSSTTRVRSQSAADQTTPTPQRKLVKSFSLRSVSSLLRSSPCPESSPNSGFEQASSAAPTQPLVRGLPSESPEPEPAGADSGSSRPRSPGTPENPSRTRKSSAAVSSLWKRHRKPSPDSMSHQASCGPDNGDATYHPLSLSFLTDGLLDDDFITGLSFSKRGSVMLGGERALALDTATMDNQQSHQSAPSRDQPRSSLDNGAKPAPSPTNNLSSSDTPASESVPRSESAASNETPDTGYVTPDAVPQTQQPDQQHQPPQDPQLLSPPPDIRVMAADVDRDSQKVRSLYAANDTFRWEDGALPSLAEQRTASPIEEVSAEEDEQDPTPAGLTPSVRSPRSAGSSSLRPSSAYKKESEVAGGFEDYEDVDGALVDRYGFIKEPPRPGSSRIGTPTEMKSAQFSPRRRNVLQKRDPHGVSSPLSGRRPPSRKVSARSLNTQHSGFSTTSLKSSRSVMRQAGNLLPYNRERRWMDEAGDMLTVSPSLQDIAEEARIERISESLKRKEIERSEKWRKMAKVTKGAQGEGMDFDFDVKNPKLIERTWKGIPDCWRTAAWYSFMEGAAKNTPGSSSSEDLIAEFHRLQEKSSPDDVQIDLDVPRTINRHIMFRRRYRGGQRLLFRVLHALSIYFPVTGYVQGMASLGATLLCYFDEEKCFVMLVRMWQLRGLDRLYRPGFEGLMTGLKEFEGTWLHKDVAKKLEDLCIDSTAYGTRWYLTLFNLSIPFPAQLRVWDVFLLLGGAPSGTTESKSASKKRPNTPTPPSTGLDILHATSAALIQALREVLLDSDFENAMRALTSFIPVKDEDLLMKVTRAEWKAHVQGKKKA